MPITSSLKFIFLTLLFYGCHSKVDRITINNEHLALSNNIVLYKQKPYSGILYSKIDTVTTYRAAYVNGKKDGEEQKFFFNGKLSESKFYTQGKKTGTHRTWWNNNQLMSEYHFDYQGNYIGKQREWFSNGKLLKELNYTNGKETGNQKKWNFEGKLIANYEVIDGETFGLISSNTCKPDSYVD